MKKLFEKEVVMYETTVANSLLLTTLIVIGAVVLIQKLVMLSGLIVMNIHQSLHKDIKKEEC